MKESTLATKLMMGILCVGVLLYLALYFLLGFRNEIATTIAYHYTVDVGREATAIVVRDEVVLDSTGAHVDMVLSEGEKAAARSVVALIYSDPSALDTRQQIRMLEAEIEQLEYSLSMGTQSVDSNKLDDQVISAIVDLRALVSQGDLTSLDESVLDLRTMVFQRDYTYGDEDAAQHVRELIDEKKQLLDTMQRSLNQISQAVRAPVAGVFSGETDGYEALVTPDKLPTISLGELDAILTGKAPKEPSAAGKIITSSTWYLAALFEGSNDLGLREGRTYTISFSHDYYGNVPMTLERIETLDGQTMAVFSARTHLSDTTLLRIQTVDIVAENVTGIRIPRKALRVETKSVTDENGKTTQTNIYGVYTIVGSQAEWQDVNVLYTGDTFYLVEPANEDASGRLRAGDTVILTSTGLYDGKVVR